ncbi:MFS transporter [Ilumatobacter sp.]|uniref:MFS transporter n=1 Tax=Ilumatobacter sp. TaxID=1967498 RepID=UPI003B5222C8
MRDVRRGLGAPFRTLCSAAALSSTGTGITDAALPLLVLAIAGEGATPAALGLVAAATQLPVVLFALPSGIIADRYSRRTIMLASDAGRAVCLAIFALVVLVGDVTVWTTAIAAFGVGVGRALFTGAIQPLLPTLVPDDQLDSANGRLTTATDVGAEFVGPPIGSLLFSIASCVPFVADAATYVVSSVLVARLPADAPGARASQRPRVGPAFAAVRCSATLRSLWFALVVLALCNSVVSTLAVLVLSDRVGLSERYYGLALTVLASGGIVSGLVSSRLSARWGSRRVLVAAIVVNAGSYVVFGLATSIAVSFAALVAWGFSVTTGVIIAMSMRQRLTTDDIRGRVMSVFRFGIGVGGVLGAVAAGIITAEIGLTTTIVGSAVVQLLAAVVIVSGGRAEVVVVDRAQRTGHVR